MSKIHATAIIESGAKIDEDVSVGAYSIIGANVRIKRGTIIASHVVIEGNTEIGEDNRIFQFASIGAIPQDLKYMGEPSTLVIGSGNMIREYVTMHPGTKGGLMTTVVGDRNLFMANSHVAHDCVIGSDNVFANSAALAGHVTITSNVIVGGLVGIHQFCRVGNYAFVSGGSMVGHDVPPFSIAQGDRCYMRGLNLIGLQRAGFTSEQITSIKKAYRLLFTSGGHIKGDKSELLPEELRQEEPVKLLLEFIATTSRGMLAPASASGRQTEDE